MSTTAQPGGDTLNKKVTIKRVIEQFKKMDDPQKMFISGVMQGILLERKRGQGHNAEEENAS